ncbi:MAG: penicillin-binding transpeptidase domain-containing protein, partial [Acinetobacter sp.]
ALERGMTPYTMVDDAPITIGKWSPRNSDGRYLGQIPLRRALYLSRNTVSVRLLQSVGVERARQLLMDFGLQQNRIPRNFTIALGTPQVLPIQMATGYATFANGGYRVEPYFIDHIEDAYGKVIYRANPEYACISCIQEDANTAQGQTQQPATPDDEAFVEHQPMQQANHAHTQPLKLKRANANNSDYRQAQRIIKSASAYDMANILRDVILSGTGRAALRIGRDDLGGKTGTTNDAKDAWFAGFNGKLVTVTWVGFDQPTTLGRKEYGGVAALPLWINFMAKSLQGTPSAWVSFDKDAKAPALHNQNVGQVDQRENRVNPPLARPAYRPAPIIPKREPDSDFSDLPGEEIMIPTTQTPPKVNHVPANTARTPDPMEELIHQMN